MGLEVGYKEYWIFGGRTNDTTYLTSTEIYKEDEFIVGPDLLEPMGFHSAAMINYTHLFIGNLQNSAF